MKVVQMLEKGVRHVSRKGGVGLHRGWFSQSVLHSGDAGFCCRECVL